VDQLHFYSCIIPLLEERGRAELSFSRQVCWHTQVLCFPAIQASTPDATLQSQTQTQTQHPDNNAIKPPDYSRVMRMIHGLRRCTCTSGFAVHHRTLGRIRRHLDAPCVNHSVKKGVPGCSHSQVVLGVNQFGEHFSQSPSPKLRARRRLPTHAALLHSLHQNGDEHLRRAVSVRGPSTQRLLPRTTGYCRHGCVGGRMRPG
jgi:hypothetical protein